MNISAQGKGPEGRLAQIPMGRVGTAAETAALGAALCTVDAGYTTGVSIATRVVLGVAQSATA